MHAKFGMVLLLVNFIGKSFDYDAVSLLEDIQEDVTVHLSQSQDICGVFTDSIWEFGGIFHKLE